MKVVRSVRLWMKEGTSDKIYEVDLVDLERSQDAERFIVNFRYGRRGTTLREGTKTPSPVAQANAETLFDSVVVSKVNDGYRRLGEPSALAAGPQAQAVGRDAELLKQLAACLRSPWPAKERDRLFWRLGVIRLEAAWPQLAAMVEKLGASEASYSLVHALARCGGPRAVEALSAIARVNIGAATRDYALYALGSDLMGARKQPPGLSLPPGTSAVSVRQIEDAIAVADGAGLVQCLETCSASQPGFANQFLIALAHRAQANPSARAALLSALRVVAVAPPFVQVLRRLFKYADLTDDGALFAATARKFELARPMYRRGGVYRDRVWIAGLREPLKLSEERTSANPRIALSDVTLFYFKRRAWRTLRKRAELGQDAFTAMATELLLAFSETDGEKPARWNGYTHVDGRYQRSEQWTEPFRRVWSVSHLLHGSAPTSQFKTNSLTLTHAGVVQPDLRSEAFPALWDAQPERLLRLAAMARNRPAAVFAVQALGRGPERPEAMEAAAVTGLLSSPYAEVNAFAVSIARRLVEAGRAEGALAAALLGAGTAELQQLGVRAVNARAGWPWSDTGLALAVLTTAQEAIQPQARAWLQDRRPTRNQAVVLTEAFAAWLGELPAELDDFSGKALRFALTLLPSLWPGHDCPLAPQIIENLTGHACAEVQAAGIQLLAVTPIRPDDLPQPFWTAILQAKAPEIRAASMSLLARLEPASLAGHAETILAAATSEHADLRAAARPLVARLAAGDPGFAGQLRDVLMTGFFRAEPVDGHAADMALLFLEGLPAEARSVDAGTLWRLLQAKAKGARILGSQLLQTTDPAVLSVKQIARLGNHAFAAVRRWALHALETNEARFRGEPEDAVLFVESEWEDTRTAAMLCFTAWPHESLPASALAVMADSTVPTVQESARHLLRSSLAGGDVATVLRCILEHPSGSFHLFVTELITGEALDEPDVFAKFLIQARIILMQINRGRVAKDRVVAVLRREALARHDRAPAIRDLLHDMTLSVVGKDKAPALVVLRDIAHAWPDIGLPHGVIEHRPAGPALVSVGSAA